jgi:hypothetical protein
MAYDVTVAVDQMTVVIIFDVLRSQIVVLGSLLKQTT